MGFFDFFTQKIGIDLGTSNTLVYVNNKGIIVNEPSVVAINTLSNEVCAVGSDAKAMLDRTPKTIRAIRPLQSGVIADFEITRAMIKYFIAKALNKKRFIKSNIVISVPVGVTSIERRAVEEVAYDAGARKVKLVEEPMAAAIGAGLEIAEPSGSIIVDIGGGTTEVAVISLGGIVVSNSIRIAGDELDENIINYVKREMNLAIGDTTAEQIKKEIGCAMPLVTELTMDVSGRDLTTGLPQTLKITSTQVEEAIHESVEKIVDTIRQTLERTPPELSSDIMEKGIVLAGGGALIKNIDKLVAEKTEMPVYIATDPLECVVKGTGKTLEDLERLKTVLINSRKRK